MSIEGQDRFRAWAVSVLLPLTWDAERQIRYVQQLGVGVDELALQLNDAFHLARAKNADELLDDAAYEAITAIDAQFSKMTQLNDDQLWNKSALFDSPHWRLVRDLAAEAYMLFN